MATLVREVRIGGKEGWKEDHTEIFGYSEAVEAIVSGCEGLKELYVWGIKEGLHASAIAQGKCERSSATFRTCLRADCPFPATQLLKR